MSLRQRGQRPSEASHESGYNAGGSRQPPSAPSSGGYHTPQPARKVMPRTVSAGPGGGGYYNPDPAASGYAGNPVYAGNPAAPAAPLASAGYHAAAAQAPHAGGDYFRSESMPALGAAPPAPPTPARGGAAQLFRSGGGRGGGLPSTANNPYQHSKSSPGATCRRAFLGLLALTSLVLAGTAVHFRGIMKAREAELDDAKRIDLRGGRDVDAARAGPGRRRPDAEPRTRDVDERARLERDVRQLQAAVAAQKVKHAGAVKRNKIQVGRLEGQAGRRQDLAKSVEHTVNVLADATAETEKYKAMVDGMDAVEEYMTKREGALWDRIDLLESRIGKGSWREAVEWFGPGPHRVEMDLEYPRIQQTNPNPDAATWPLVRGTIVLEMAPLHLMPHAVNLFLQQVHHRLWNSCAINRSANHIFQVGPSYRAIDAPGDDDGGDTKTHYEHFRAKGLDKATYQEYNEGYPHEQWTVGLAGRPGGPDFYINKKNNTKIHGPGGQLNKHDLHNEADPCFGKVLEGIETLTEIGGVPTDPESNYAFKYPVAILEARVLVQKDNPADGWQVVPPGEKSDHGQIMPLRDVPLES